VSEFTNPRNIQTTTRRNIAMVKHSITSQIKNRITWEDGSLSLVGLAVIVCKGKSRSQTKSSDFNSLRSAVSLLGRWAAGVGCPISRYLSAAYRRLRLLLTAGAGGGEFCVQITS
jgi:hypothetical protein